MSESRASRARLPCPAAWGVHARKPRGSCSARVLRSFPRAGSRPGPLFVIALAVLAVACSAPSAAQRETRAAPYHSDEEGRLVVRDDLSGLLRASAAEGGEVAARLEGFGRITFAPDASYAVTVPFDAYVEAVHASAGERVEEGAPLATLRSSALASMRADARRLAALIEGDRDALERLERLVEEGAASTRELIEVRSRLTGSEAELRGIRGALGAVRAPLSGADRLTLTATAAGEVLVRNVDPGERLAADSNEPAFVIGDPERVVVLASFPERDAPLLREGAACRFELPSLGRSTFDGTVRRVTAAVDADTRAAQAVCEPESIGPSLRAGMAARIEVDVFGEGAVTIERGALLMRRDDYVVFVQHAPGVLERRVVRPGASIGSRVQVLEGVAPGEMVIAEHAVLLDGELDRLL